MKRISKILLLGGVAAAAFVALLAALFLLMPGGGEDSAQASGGTGNPPTIFGIDVDPAGNSCTPPVEDPPTDGYCTLGEIDKCIRVESVESGTYPGPVFNVDVFMDDISTGKDLVGGDWFMHYDSVYIKVERILPSPARCNAWLLGMKLGSGCADNGEKPWPALPDVDGTLLVSMVDSGGQATAELPSVAGQDLGVLDRYQLAVTAAGPKVVPITFRPGGAGGTYFASTTMGRYGADQVWDGAYTPKYGLIAIDTPCPIPTDLKKVLLEALDDQLQPLPQPLELNVSETYLLKLHEKLHNNGPMTPLLSNLTVEGTPPEGGSVSYHVSQDDLDLPGDLLVTKNGQPWVGDPWDGGLNPPASTVFVVDYP